MLTTYGFSISTTNKQVQQTAIELVFQWLNEVHPIEKRTKSTQISIRHEANDPVFRIDVLQPDSQPSSLRGTVATLMVLKNNLYFDLRRTIRPIEDFVLPRRITETPEPRLIKLVMQITKLFKSRDAQQIISEEIAVANDHLSGQSLAAFISAPSRRLPIVVEVVTAKAQLVTTPLTAQHLTGIAHVAHISSRVAEEAFNNLYGARVISTSWVSIFWPRRTDPENFHQLDDEQLVKQLIGASVGSLGILRVSPSKNKLRHEPATSGATNLSEIAKLHQEVENLKQTNAELQEENESLSENLVRTDMVSAINAEKKELAESRLVAFLSGQEDPAYLRRDIDAVAEARKNCPNLIFHQRAIDSVRTSNQNTGQRIYSSLLHLNNVVVQLQRGDFEPKYFNFQCTQQLSSYESSISDSAVNKYAEDYSISWKGENVIAKPHIRCGDTRIHIYHDMTTNEVVVAYIGRHLRDKSTN